MATQVQSLFGITPESYQAQQQAALDAQALQFAKLSPMQQAQMGLFRGASQLGTGLAGLMGYQDPEMQRIKARQGLLGGIDMSDPAALRQAARQAQQNGDFNAAQELAARADEVALNLARISKETALGAQATAEAQRKEFAFAQEEKLREELAALPPEATDAQVEQVVRKYGKPDDIFKTIERRTTAEANRVAKLELEREKAAAREAEKERDRAFREQMALLAQQQRAATNDLQREMLRMRMQDMADAKAAKADKQQMAQDMAVRHAQKVISDVSEATNLVSGFTTGVVGKASSFVPGTDAYNLNQRVLTIKANLGFDRLQQMRDASPTGGALGQVAVQELEALQASVGSLEVGQSKDELLKNLNKIDKHYKAWLEAVQGTQPSGGSDGNNDIRSQADAILKGGK